MSLVDAGRGSLVPTPPPPTLRPSPPPPPSDLGGAGSPGLVAPGGRRRQFRRRYSGSALGSLRGSANDAGSTAVAAEAGAAAAALPPRSGRPPRSPEVIASRPDQQAQHDGAAAVAALDEVESESTLGGALARPPMLAHAARRHSAGQLSCEAEGEGGICRLDSNLLVEKHDGAVADDDGGAVVQHYGWSHARPPIAGVQIGRAAAAEATAAAAAAGVQKADSARGPAPAELERREAALTGDVLSVTVQ
eukprot:SAG11_NODE_2153_length_3740_cov_13.654765_2_plen_249_part_00